MLGIVCAFSSVPMFSKWQDWNTTSVKYLEALIYSVCMFELAFDFICPTGWRYHPLGVLIQSFFPCIICFWSQLTRVLAYKDLLVKSVFFCIDVVGSVA